MKNHNKLLVMIIIGAIAVFLFSGFTMTNFRERFAIPAPPNEHFINFHAIEHEGHQYLVACTKNGVCMIHSASCSCGWNNRKK